MLALVRGIFAFVVWGIFPRFPRLARGEGFELGVPVEFADGLGILAPIGRDFHEEAEKYFCAEKFFQFFARFGADFLEHFSFAADQDFLLGIALDVQGHFDAKKLGRFLPFVHGNGEGVRNFVVGARDGFFADDFGGKETFGLVGDLIFGKVRDSFGQKLQDFAEEVFAARTRESGNRDDSGKFVGLRECVDQREEFGFGEFVDLVERQDGFAAEALGFFDEEAVRVRVHHGGVREEKKDVDAFESGGDFAHHLLVQDGIGFVQAGRIYEDDLAFGAVDDALNAVAGGLRLGGDDGNFLADETVEERGLSGVGAANDGDKAGALRCGLFPCFRHANIVDLI